jgi:hypothetical protein
MPPKKKQDENNDCENLLKKKKELQPKIEKIKNELNKILEEDEFYKKQININNCLETNNKKKINRNLNNDIFELDDYFSKYQKNKDIEHSAKFNEIKENKKKKEIKKIDVNELREIIKLANAKVEFDDIVIEDDLSANIYVIGKFIIDNPIINKRVTYNEQTDKSKIKIIGNYKIITSGTNKIIMIYNKNIFLLNSPFSKFKPENIIDKKIIVDIFNSVENNDDGSIIQYTK